jgi:16S rRNA (guanine527-N7)-methyltransferase
VIRSDERPSLPLPCPTPLEPPPHFAARLKDFGVHADAQTIAKIGDYLARLLAMNEQMNLTAIENPNAAWERHAFDALTLVPLLEEVGAGGRIADIGSGGGLPGIPIAIIRPDLFVTLVEATQKKAAFLSAVTLALGLSGVVIQAERAEKLIAGPLRETFDAVTARAVARLTQLIPITAPFVKPGGRLLLIKGQKANEELTEAARVLVKQRMRHIKTITTPTGRIVVLVKT